MKEYSLVAMISGSKKVGIFRAHPFQYGPSNGFAHIINKCNDAEVFLFVWRWIEK
jgi:hypothetical protein